MSTLSIANFPFRDIFEIALITALILAFGHYFRWENILGRPLGRVGAYIYGTLAIAIPVTAFLLANAWWWAAAGLWSSIVAGGSTVMALYGIDAWSERSRRLREAEERESHLLTQIRSE